MGVYDYAPESVVTKGRLKPGEMIAVDTQTGKLLLSSDIDEMLKNRHPYQQWMRKHAQRLEDDLTGNKPIPSELNKEELLAYP